MSGPVTNVILARSLGPDGRGVYAVAVMVSSAGEGRGVAAQGAQTRSPTTATIVAVSAIGVARRDGRRTRSGWFVGSVSRGRSSTRRA